MAEGANSTRASSISPPVVYVVENCETMCLSDTLMNVKKLPCLKEIPADFDLVFLGEAKHEQSDSVPILSPVQYLIEVYRQAGLADKERQTILTHDDQLVSLQLCMAQHNKQKFDDFDVDASEVLQLSHQLYNHKLIPTTSSSNICGTQSTLNAVEPLPTTSSSNICGTQSTLNAVEPLPTTSSSNICGTQSTLNAVEPLPTTSSSNICGTQSTLNAVEPLPTTSSSNICGTQSTLNAVEPLPTTSSSNICGTQSTLNAVEPLYREFCKSCNTIDILGVFNKVKSWFADDSCGYAKKKCIYVVLQWPRTELEVEIVKLLCTEGIYCCVTMESSDACSDDVVEVSSRDESVENLIPRPSLENVPTPSKSASEILSRQLFISYLTLLVNSCNEISLARCLSLTTDDFNHDGFTALKNIAKAKNMPMFQTAVSYVMQIRLGGKSYAPKPNSPLAPHVKGLSDFVTTVQKLQTLAEEEADTRTAVSKILSSIRSSLCKCKVSTLRKSSIDAVTEQLKQEAENLMGCWTGSLVVSPPRKIEGQGRIVYGMKTYRILQAVLDQEAGRTLTKKPIHVLTDGFTSQKTPMRIPSLLSQFRSPVVEDPSSPEYQTLRSRLFSPQEKKPVCPAKWKSDLTWAAPTVDIRNNIKDMDIVSPVRKRQQSKRTGLWAHSPGGRHKHSSLISPNDVDIGNPDVDSAHCISNKLTVRSRTVDSTDTPKKGKTIRKLPKDSSLDQENLQNKDKSTKLGGSVKQRKPKRTLEEDSSCSSQSSKKAKKATKKASRVSKKKVVPLGKGQKTLNQFFRV